MNHFVYSMMNGLLGNPLLESVDYRPILMEEGSAAEQACALFCNVLELDVDGRPINANEAEIKLGQRNTSGAQMSPSTVSGISRAVHPPPRAHAPARKHPDTKSGTPRQRPPPRRSRPRRLSA